MNKDIYPYFRPILFDLNSVRNLNSLLFISFLLIILSGCGGGGGDRTALSTGSTTQTGPGTEVIKITGSVGDGPVIGANIKVLDANGKVILNTTSDSQATYSISISSKTAFPVVITSTGGTDIVTGLAPDFTMKTVAFKRSNLNAKHTVNINPFSTFMVTMTESMSGGLSAANSETAKNILFDTFNFGLDESLVADPITSQITNSNIANIIKASEVMGEMIRRTRDAIIASGTSTDGDEVINMLSLDLANGKLDGTGTNVNPAISSTAKLVSGQVLVESFQNKLKVNNLLSNNLLNEAISTTKPDSIQRMEDVTLTESVIAQAVTALLSADRLSSNSEIVEMINAVSSLTPTNTLSEINASLSTVSSATLTSVINLAPLATSSQTTAILDDTSANTTNTDNTALLLIPVITSDPIRAAKVDIAYRYDVNATDANQEDTLQYNLKTAPSGMSINSETGLINWTPSAAQIGQHTISIRVSDNSSAKLSVTQNYTLTVSNKNYLYISNTSPSRNVWDTFQNGTNMYSDRTYQFGTDSENQVPSKYAGISYLKLAKADRLSVGNDLLRFDVSQPVTVFIAHDDRIVTKPSWLSDWTDTGDDFKGRSIYKKDHVAGLITLGGNTIDGIDTGFNMYFAFMKPQSANKGTRVLVDGTKGSLSTTSTSELFISVSNTVGDIVSLIEQPSNGTLSIFDGKILNYTPNEEFSGTETITYMITSPNGDISINTITLLIECTSCNKSVIFDLYWDAVNSSETGYKIYYGSTETTATNLAYDVAVNSLTNPQTPSAVVTSSDLGLQSGDTACFRIKTYDSDNNSSVFSSAVCATI